LGDARGDAKARYDAGTPSKQGAKSHSMFSSILGFPRAMPFHAVVSVQTVLAGVV
jgi:hypothetical protein